MAYMTQCIGMLKIRQTDNVGITGRGTRTILIQQISETCYILALSNTTFSMNLHNTLKRHIPTLQLNTAEKTAD